MNCNETLALLDAYLDGELDLVRHLEVETHVKSCPTCAAAAETGRLAREVMRQGLTRYAASPALAKRIQEALPQTFPTIEKSKPSPRKNPARGRSSLWLSLAGTTSLAAVFCLGFFAGTSREQSRENETELIAAHVRSLMGSHLTDVASTDQHNVKPWFAGKVDFAPPVLDLSEQGFPLAGGRLEQIDRHAAVALVYRRRQHTINLFVWPKAGSPRPEKSFQATGYHALGWANDDLNFLAVSDVSTPDLELFAKTFQASAK